MKNIKSRALEAGQHAQYAQPYSECLFISAYSSYQGVPAFGESHPDSHLADVVEERCNLQILELGFFQT